MSTNEERQQRYRDRMNERQMSVSQKIEYHKEKILEYKWKLAKSERRLRELKEEE